MKTIFLLTFIAVLFSSPSNALCADPQPDGWQGMVLNVSRPEDAIKLFGQAAKDKDKVSLDLARPISWVSDTYKHKKFRTLIYKKLHGFKQVQFSFLDGTLAAIVFEAPNGELEDNWIDPDDLEKLFAVSFKPHQRKYKSKLPAPAEFAATAPEELKKDEYDYWYDMIAVSENSLIIAIADNYQYISGIFDGPDAKRRKKINAKGARYPGYVASIQMVSRRLAA